MTIRRNLLFYITVGLALGILLKFFVLDILHVSGDSMSPAITDGRTVLVLRCRYGILRPFSDKYLVRWGAPKAGDVVTFFHEGKIVIKRCALIEDESLEFLCDSGYSLLAGERQIPLGEAQYRLLSESGSVPQGYIFVVGDNTDASVDSRDYGFVPIKNITGKALFL